MKEKAQAIAVESDDEKVPGDLLPFLQGMQKKGLTLSQVILNLQNPKNMNQENPDADGVAPIVPRVNQFQGKNDRMRSSNGDEEEGDKPTGKTSPKPKPRPGRGKGRGRGRGKGRGKRSKKEDDEKLDAIDLEKDAKSEEDEEEEPPKTKPRATRKTAAGKPKAKVKAKAKASQKSRSKPSKSSKPRSDDDDQENEESEAEEAYDEDEMDLSVKDDHENDACSKRKKEHTTTEPAKKAKTAKELKPGKAIPAKKVEDDNMDKDEAAAKTKEKQMQKKKKVKAGDDKEDDKGDGESEQAAKALPKSFARRPCPKTSPASDRWIAIQKTYKSQVVPKILEVKGAPYSWEDWGVWVWVRFVLFKIHEIMKVFVLLFCPVLLKLKRCYGQHVQHRSPS